MEGWVKLHRKFPEWEWYNDNDTKALFIHLLLNANFKDNTWRGIEIKRGQFITSYSNLSHALSMGVQRVRTSLSKLCKTGEITRKSTSKYTIITICNFEYYQDDDFQTNTQINKQNDQQLTRKQHATNTQLTTTEERKERKECKENNSVVVDKAREIENFRNEIYTSQIKLQNACFATRLDASTFLQYAEEVIARWTVTEPDDVSWSHLINAVSKKRQEDAKVQKTSEASEKAQRRAELEAIAQRCYYESIKPTNKN